jgi:hypothetical protein
VFVVTTESQPADRHVVEETQSTEEAGPSPNGGLLKFQLAPPFAVDMIVDPKLTLPGDPTATQVSAVSHETPVRSIALPGAVWTVQVVPEVDEVST